LKSRDVSRKMLLVKAGRRENFRVRNRRQGSLLRQKPRNKRKRALIALNPRIYYPKIKGRVGK
jgi:hypothetical protein